MKWKKLMSAILSGAMVMTSVAPAAVWASAVEEVTAQSENTEEVEETVLSKALATYDMKDFADTEDENVLSDGSKTLTLESVGTESNEKPSLVQDDERGQVLQTIRQSSTNNASNRGDALLANPLKGQNGENGLTLNFWTKNTGAVSGNRCLIDFEVAQATTGRAGTFDINQGMIYWNTVDQNAYYADFKTDTVTWSLGEWQMITITISNEGLTVYSDGQEKTVTISGQYANNPENIYTQIISDLTGTDNVRLGASMSNYWAASGALLDDISFFNTSLTAQEVAKLYQETKPVEKVDLEALLSSVTATGALKMTVGKTRALQLSGLEELEAYNPTLSYESTAPAVASVSDQGIVTALTPGETVIKTTLTVGQSEESGEDPLSVILETVVTVKEAVELPDPIAKFDFEDNLKDSSNDNNQATAVTTGISEYTGEVTYVEGRTEGTKAIQLGSYGLDLNMKNLGKTYTVSAWVKTDKLLTFAMPIIFLGYNNPEKWAGIVSNTAWGGESTTKTRIWYKADDTYGEFAAGKMEVADGTWHHLILSGDNGRISTYMDGTLIASEEGPDALEGENQGIYLGVNFWDDEFTGVVDDVQIFNTALSAEEVLDVYGGVVEGPAPTPEPTPVPEVLADFDFDTEAVDGVFTGGNAIATAQGDGVELAEGLEGNNTALKLNGSSDSWLKVTDAEGNFLLKGLDEFTISYDSNTTAEGSSGAGWAFYTAPNDSAQTYLSEKYLGIMDLGGNINVERYNSNSQERPSKTTGSAISQWKHVDIVFGKNSTILYINGVKQDEQTSTVDIEELLGDDGVFYIGRANWGTDGEYFAGLIDNFKIYSSAKTEAQIQEKVTTVTTTYVAGENGKLTGTTKQVSLKGANTTSVTAVANRNYKFVKWDDGVTTAKRQDVATEDKTYTAIFEEDLTTDKTSINSLIADAKSRAESGYYTEESSEALKAVVEEVETAAETASTRAEFNALKEQLQEAINNLEVKPEELVPTPEAEAPAQVTGVTATATTTSVTLKWKAVEGAAGYEVWEWKAGSKKYVAVGTTAKLTYTVKGREAGNTYRYKVRAYREDAISNVYGKYSKIASIITKPGKVTVQSAGKKSNTTVTLKFTNSSKATSYLIYEQNAKTKKYQIAYKIQGKKLYKYIAKTKTYKAIGKASLSKNKIWTAKLTGLNLKTTDKNAKFMVKAVRSATGYKDALSAASNAKAVK